MKKALKVVLNYFLLLLIGLLTGTVIYSLLMRVFNTVIGNAPITMQLQDFIKSFFYAAFCVLVVICPFAVYTNIRTAGGLPRLFAFIFVSLLTWGALLPVTIHFGQKFSCNEEYTFSKQGLSSGYFRQSGTRVYYFLRSFDDAAASADGIPAVVINTAQDGSVGIKKVINWPGLELYKSAQPYRDVLIKQSIGESTRSGRLIGFDSFLSRAVTAWSKGITFWLGFVSLGFVLCSLYGISRLFKWRLICATGVLFSAVGILCVNTLYFLPFFDSFKARHINSRGVFLFLSDYVDEPFLVCLNVLVGLLFIALGIIHAASASRKSRKQQGGGR